VFGPLTVTRAFLPLMHEFKAATGRDPRLIMVGSPMGNVVRPLSAVYAGTKAALAALTEGFSLELPYPVTLLEPGGYGTEIWNTWGAGGSDPKWGPYQARFEKIKALSTSVKFPPPDPVAEDVLHVLTARFPPRRHCTGKEAYLLGVMGFLCPDSVWALISNAIFGTPDAASFTGHTGRGQI